MQTKWTLSSLMFFTLVAGCVTINVYFPAVAAEKAADKIIEDVWGKSTNPSGNNSNFPTPQSRLGSPGLSQNIALAVLNFMLPVAEAAEPNLEIDTPAVRNIVSAMEARHKQLKPYYESGALGLTQEATISIHNMGTVSLANRNQLKKLVAEENADRNALYREIAVANSHPEWESKIRATFAERWVSKAQSGWYYQAGGQWQQK